MASSPSSDEAAPERPTYADATARPPGSTVTLTPRAPPIAQLLPLLGMPSLRPHTSLFQLTFADWNPDWDNGEDDANDTEGSNAAPDLGGTEETKQDNAVAVDDNKAAAPEANAHTADDATSLGSSSPPLLSIPPSPEPLGVKTPLPSGHTLLDSNAAINHTAEAPWMPTPSIGDLPKDGDDPMAKLTRAISTHLAKLDCQCLAIGAKYDTFCDLLVNAQTDFNVSALERRVCSAVGAHTAPLIELLSNAEAAINIKYDNISALHVTSKAALTEAMTLLDASKVNRRALAAVDNAMMAAMAPDGLMDQCISKAVTSAVITAVNKIVEREIQPRVQHTLDEIFVSYQDCVIDERKRRNRNLRHHSWRIGRLPRRIFKMQFTQPS